jgi:hypothetical protein
MQPKQLWDDLLSRSKESEFEISTVPQTKSVPLWFVVKVVGDYLVIKNAKYNVPSVKLSHERKISYKDFELVFGYYDRWRRGETGVRKEVSRKSQNTAYIFAMIAEAKKQRI